MMERLLDLEERDPHNRISTTLLPIMALIRHAVWVRPLQRFIKIFGIRASFRLSQTIR